MLNGTDISDRAPLDLQMLIGREETGQGLDERIDFAEMGHSNAVPLQGQSQRTNW
jgi:hypothetical protein